MILSLSLFLVKSTLAQKLCLDLQVVSSGSSLGISIRSFSEFVSPHISNTSSWLMTVEEKEKNKQYMRPLNKQHIVKGSVILDHIYDIFPFELGKTFSILAY